jgi:hypothetical protein
MQKFKPLKMLLMSAFAAFLIVSCQEDFNEEDALRLQAELEAQAQAREDSVRAAEAALNLEELRVRDSLLRLGGRIDYTVAVIAGGNTATTSGRGPADGATVTIKQNGIEFSGSTDASGTVYVPDLRIGNATMTVSAPDHTTGTFIVDLTPAEAEAGDVTIDYSTVTRNAATMITLFPTTMAAGAAEITGRVTGEVDLTNAAPEPLAGVNVTGTIDVDNNFISKYLTPDDSPINGGFAGKVIQAAYGSASSTATTDANGDYVLVVPATASGLEINVEISDIVADRTSYSVWAADPTAPAVERVIWSTSGGTSDIYQVQGALIQIDAPTGGRESGSGASADAVIEGGDVVTALRIADAGRGFTQVPDVVFTGGSGFGAAATVTVTDGRISGVNLTSGGEDYQSTPNVDLEFGGEDASVSPMFTFSYQDDQNNGYSIPGAAIINSGDGYTSQPTATVGGDGTGATATAIAQLFVDDLTVTAIGSNYTETPLATFSGGTPLDEDNPVLASASVELDFGPVVSVGSIPAYGIGEGPFTDDKTATPTVDIDDVNGNNFNQNAAADFDVTWATTGFLEEGTTLNILNGGAGYVDGNVTVEFTGAGAPATSPAVKVTTNGNNITGIEILETTSGWDQTQTINVTITGTGAATGADAELFPNSVLYPVESISIVTGGSYQFNTLTQDQIDDLFGGSNVYGGGIVDNDMRLYVNSSDDDFLYMADLTFNRSIQQIALFDNGEYLVAPTTLDVEGNGSASFTVNGFLSEVVITEGGSGYTKENNAITISGGGATEDAELDMSIFEGALTGGGNNLDDIFNDEMAMLSGFMVNDGGSGYSAAPNVAVEVPGGSGDSYGIATATVAGGEVTAVALANGPVMYDFNDLNNINFTGVPVDVTIWKDNGSLEAELSSGSVVAINVTDGGSGYDSANPPTVFIEPAGDGVSQGDQGSGAEATAVVQDGRVVAVNVTSGGSGYLSAPNVIFVEPNATAANAEAIAVVNPAGEITNVLLRASGSVKDDNYYDEGTTGPGTSGEGYITVPNVTAVPLVAGSGSGAVLEAIINAAGQVDAINVINGGSGYLGGNTVYFPDGSTTPMNSDGGDNISAGVQTISGQSNGNIISGKSHVRDYYMGTGRKGSSD